MKNESVYNSSPVKVMNHKRNINVADRNINIITICCVLFVILNDWLSCSNKSIRSMNDLHKIHPPIKYYPLWIQEEVKIPWIG